MAFNKSVFRFAQGATYADRSMPCKMLATPSAQCMGIAASHKWVASVYGTGNNVLVLPLDHKEFKRNDNPPVVTAHGQAITDLRFSPWDGNLLVTGSEDGYVKSFEIPADGMTANVSAPKAKIELKSPIRHMAFHPSAEGVLAVGCKNGLKILDLNKGEIKHSFDVAGYSSDTVSVAWNHDGSLLAALGKNSALHLFDPRTAAFDQLATFATIDSKKPQHCFFVKNRLAVVAQNNTQKPFFAFYDPADLSKPTFKKLLDFSPGIVIPLYDPDTDLIFLTLRGASLVTVYDVSESKGEPQFNASSKFVVDDGLKGAALIPKGACSHSATEIDRMVGLTQKTVEAVGVRIPRKKGGFAPELFPDTRDAAPAMSAEAYFGGQNAAPLMIGVQALASKLFGNAPAAKAPANVAAAAPTAPGVSTHTGGAAGAAAARAAAAAKAAKDIEDAKIRLTTKDIAYNTSDTRGKIDSLLKGSLYRHCSGKEPRESADTWYKVPATSSCYLSQNLKCSSKFVCVATKVGTGSTLAVFDAHKPSGRAETPFCLKGHKAPITCFEMSVLDPHRVVTCSQDGAVNVWRIPEGGLTAHITEPVCSFQAAGKVTTCRLSEAVGGLLAVGSTGPKGHVLQIYDLEARAEMAEIEGFHDDAIVDIQFDDIGRLLATSCKDKRVRVLDFRNQETVAELVVDECLRDTQVTWVSDHLLLVHGTGSGSRRSISMWDITTKKSLQKFAVDSSSATMITHYDRDMRVLFAANNGGTTLQTFQINLVAPFIANLNSYKSPSMFQGSCFLPKRSGVDVKAVKVAHSFKLCEDKVIPIEWTIPRKRVEFFQDDLFPATWDEKALCTATEWFNGKHPQGAKKAFLSLQPAGMVKLSEAPAEELTVRQMRYQAHITKDEGPIVKGALGHESAEQVSEYFTQVAKEMPKNNRFDAVYDEAAKDVDEDEWGSD